MYISLHNHCDGSLLDSTIKPEQLVLRVKEYNMPAVALTEHGSMATAVEFVKAATDQGVKPIVGLEAYFCQEYRPDLPREDICHITLLSKNDVGYKNLLHISSRANVDYFRYHPLVPLDLLQRYHDGLICLTGCPAGYISQKILAQDINRAVTFLLTLKDIFADDLYIEIMNHGLEDEATIIPYLIDMSKRFSVPLVATNDVHYISKSDAYVHKVLLAVNTKTTVSELKGFEGFDVEEYYLKPPHEFEALFKELPDAVNNSNIIAEKVIDNPVPELVNFSYLFPTLPVGDPAIELRRLCEGYAPQRLWEKYHNPQYAKRLDYELGVIEQLGFPSYFLIVHDFVKYAREQGIPMGPGRGSGGGSLVCYVLGITNLDPIEYGLLFERFLNPGRVAMPDLDLDFCFERRGEVFDYIRNKYGKDRVINIGTSGTLGAKAVLKDVMRALGIDFNTANDITKLIPAEPEITIAEALSLSPSFAKLALEDNRIKNVIEIARKLEGLRRHASVHAAGIVIAPDDVTKFLPLRRRQDTICAEFNMHDVEHIGLVKMDLLGLRTLTVIKETIDTIAERLGITIDIDSISLDDAQVFDYISSGRTHGVFQLEQDWVMPLLHKFCPKSIKDLAVFLSLIRPGPRESGMLDAYIHRKNGEETVYYDHPLLEPILKDTYGVIVYQEQVIKMVSALANFTPSQADIMRKAIGKKDKDLMQQQRDLFINGCTGNNIDTELAEKIFNDINKFAGYSFNQSHATAYAIIAYQTAWLKYYYPVYYMTALLNSVLDKPDKLSIWIQDAQAHRILVLPPNINKSGVRCSVEAGYFIRLGFTAVKGIGEGAAEYIVENQPYSSLLDFLSRTKSRQVTSKVVSVLIESGAFACLGYKTSSLITASEELFTTLSKMSRKTLKSQAEKRLVEIDSQCKTGNEKLADLWNLDDKLFECHIRFPPQLLWMGKHPRQSHMVSELTGFRGTAFVTGVVSKVSEVTIKKGKSVGQKMAIISFSDHTGAITVLAFPEAYNNHRSIIRKGNILFARLVVEDKAILKEAILIRVPEYVPEKNAAVVVEYDNIDKLISKLLSSPPKYPVNLYVVKETGGEDITKISLPIMADIQPDDEMVVSFWEEDI